jgi:hypothetical protein
MDLQPIRAGVGSLATGSSLTESRVAAREPEAARCGVDARMARRETGGRAPAVGADAEQAAGALRVRTAP